MAGWEHHNTEPLGAADPFDVVVDQVRFGEVALAEDGQLGAAATAGINVDDPEGNLDFGGWSRWYMLETGARVTAAITGTVSKTGGDDTITGAGTAFLTELVPGDELAIPGGGGTDYVVVATVTDNTHLEVYVAPDNTAAAQVATLAGLQHTWHGIVGVQNVDRGEDRTDGGEPVAAGRDWTLDLTELNGLLHTRLGHDASYNRVAETPLARGTFLLGTTEMADLGIVDEGLVSLPTTPVLDADDLRGRPLDECWNAIAVMIKKTFSARFHEVTGNVQLVLRSPTSFYLPSGITISNYLADRGGERIWIADDAAKLTRDPTHVVDGLFGTGGRFTAYRTRAATTVDFGHRDDSAPNATIKSLAALEAYLDADLEETATQDEHGHVSIPNVPAADVNRVQKLSAVQIRMSHWPGWEATRWARVLRREIHDQVPGIYRLELDVSPCDGPPGDCGYPCTETGEFYPLGLGAPGRPKPSEGVTYYLHPGISWPSVPTPGFIGNWNFGTWGPGGAGTSDRAGDCVQNRVRLIFVGNGTAVIHTSNYLGIAEKFDVILAKHGGPAIVIDTNQPAGVDYEVTVDDRVAPNCLWYVEIYNFKKSTGACGWGINYDGVSWTSAGDTCGGDG